MTESTPAKKPFANLRNTTTVGDVTITTTMGDNGPQHALTIPVHGNEVMEVGPVSSDGLAQLQQAIKKHAGLFQ